MTQRERTISIIICALLISSSLSFSTPVLRNRQNMIDDTARDDLISGPPTSGDWIISNETTLTAETFDIRGRVFITAGGHLKLVSCDVTMHSRTDWWPFEDLCYFSVAKGGYLTLTNTHIHPETAYRWYISADGGSGVDIQGCTFEGNYPIASDDYMTTHLLSLGGWPTYERLEYAIVKDNTIDGYEGGGIWVQAESAVVEENTINDVYASAIAIYNSPNANVSHNTISNIGTVTPSGSTAQFGGTGIDLKTCINTQVSYNSITGASLRGFAWSMDTFSLVSETAGLREFAGNTVNGKEIQFAQGLSDITIGPNLDEAIVHDCENITISGFNGTSLAITFSSDVSIKNSDFSRCPVQLAYCDNVIFESNRVHDVLFWDSISIQRCSDLVLSDNVVNNSVDMAWGMHIRWSTDVLIQSNLVVNQSRWGISVLDSDSVVIDSNQVINSGTAGIAALRTEHVQIIDNLVSGVTGQGITFLGDVASYTGYTGIDVQSCDEAIITGNSISDTLCDGIWVASSNDVIISRNEISGLLGRGVVIADCFRPKIDHISLDNITWMGVELLQCTNASLSDISMSEIQGIAFYWYNKFVSARILEFSNISLNGSQLALFQDESTPTIGNDIAGAVLINCSHIRIENLECNFISFHHSDDVMIRASTIANGGIGLYYCSNATVAGCEVKDMPFINKTIYQGYMYFGVVGITVYSTENALILKNNLNNTRRGGIDLFHSIPAKVVGNSILNSGMNAIMLWTTRDTTITGNVINNTWANSISLDHTSKSDIYLNYFGYSGNHSVVLYKSEQISWDNGTHGNFYYEYNGVDENADGIGDTPFMIDSENIDSYPLVNTNHVNSHVRIFCSHRPEIGNISVSPSPLTVSGNATFMATITAEFAVSKVILSYSLDGGMTWFNISMIPTGDVWTVTILSIPAGTILFQVFAMDSLGNWDTSEQEEVTVSSTDIILIMIISGISIIAIVAVALILRKRP
ncbi:MAG: right-handed parallel beta-helix repeat-containing protein [Candidatus Thorarchaeota archaeon]